MNNRLVQIFRYFISDDNIISIVDYGNGHINDTYLVTTNKKKYILQRVNSDVFTLKNLISNYNELDRICTSHSIIGKYFPEMIHDVSGNIHRIDQSGNAWRVSHYIDGTSTYLVSPDKKTTEVAGRAMGRFQNFLNTIDPELFVETITDFHNPSKRFSDFEEILKDSNFSASDIANNEIIFALDNKYIANNMSDLIADNILPVRITHNDPKLENILFLNKNDSYVIDLDTLMKGTLVFDFGDMVRSITSLAKEDEQDLSKVIFDFNHFKALSKGYLHELSDTISLTEKKNLYPGIICIIYIQGIRFLTDFLAGNNYYKVSYPLHNLIRCRTQFKLLQEIISREKEINNFLQLVTG